MFAAPVAALLGAAMTLLPPPPLEAAQQPPPGSITISFASVNGSGCPFGTAAIALDPGATFMTVTYSQFLAQVGVGAMPTDSRKNCQAAIKVHAPQGWTFAIEKTDYRGYANLQPGAYGVERANYYFQGMSQTAYQQHAFYGPLQNDWQTTDLVGITALVFRPCGEERNFNINAQLAVYPGWSNTNTTTSYMTMDSTDVDFSTVYHFSWRRCI
jgi:hypothetical protein